jgi:hypothetical protein
MNIFRFFLQQNLLTEEDFESLDRRDDRNLHASLTFLGCVLRTIQIREFASPPPLPPKNHILLWPLNIRQLEQVPERSNIDEYFFGGGTWNTTRPKPKGDVTQAS